MARIGMKRAGELINDVRKEIGLDPILTKSVKVALRGRKIPLIEESQNILLVEESDLKIYLKELRTRQRAPIGRPKKAAS